MTAEAPDLKPCPFCGGESDAREYNAGSTPPPPPTCAWVVCGKCGAEGPLEDTREQAIERWNARAAVPA